MTEQEKAERATWLRGEMLAHAQEYHRCEAELKELNRPAWVDAKAILAEMDAREAARRSERASQIVDPLLPGLRRVTRVGEAR